MASAVEVAVGVAPRRGWLQSAGWLGAGWCAALTALVLAVGGYHPFVEDGGLYLEGVRWELDRGLYGASREFVTAHLHYSIFAPMLAGVVRWSGLSLEVVAFGFYVVSVWGTLWMGWMLAREVFCHRGEWVGATAMLAAGLAAPVAGTSLVIADPYLTARSMATVGCMTMLLAAVRWIRDRRGWRVVGLGGLGAVTAVLTHPLMAGYGVVCAAAVLGMGAVPRRWWWALGLGACAGALLLGGVVVGISPAETEAARRAGLSRTYWFLREWRWYEWMGIWAPMLLLLERARRAGSRAERVVAGGLVLGAGMAVAVAAVFARPEMGSFVVARLQPTRLLQGPYVVLFLLLGGAMGRVAGRSWRRWVSVGTVLAVAAGAAGWAGAPDLPRMELPGWAARNAWGEAFRWIEEHTPRQALVGLDAEYIQARGEDAQSFRAIAERASLPDQAKDGGEAAITPRLAGAWQRGVAAQEGLSAETDAERRRRLLPLGVSWVVLQRGAVTALPCPFQNGAVMVCRLTAE